MAELKTALVGLSKVVQKKATIPVLGTVKVERTADGWIALTGTDLDHYITVRLEQPADGEPTMILVPLEELLKTSKAVGRNDTLLIRSEENESETSGIISYPIGSQQVEHRFQALNGEEFPSIPRIKGESVTLPDAVRSSLLQAFQCASEDETRYILNGAYLDVSSEDGHYVVATDGRQLYSSNSFKLGIQDSMIIPSHKFLGWKEFNNDGEWQLKVGQKKPDDKELPPFQISSRRWRFISKQLDGNYPNWRQVTPGVNEWNSRLELEPNTLESMVQTIERMPCTDEDNFSIGLEIGAMKVQLVARSPGTETCIKIPVEARVIGNPMTIFVNRHLLTKALGFGLNTIHVIDSMSPLRISNEGRQMIIMPLRGECDAAPVAEVNNPVEPPVEEETVPITEEEQPAAPEAAPPERNTMTVPITNGQKPAVEKTSMELAFEQVESTKTALRQARDGLNTLADTLKQVQREQKASNKEVLSVKSTLEKLQSVKL